MTLGNIDIILSLNNKAPNNITGLIYTSKWEIKYTGDHGEPI